MLHYWLNYSYRLAEILTGCLCLQQRLKEKQRWSGPLWVSSSAALELASVYPLSPISEVFAKVHSSWLKPSCSLVCLISPGYQGRNNLFLLPYMTTIRGRVGGQLRFFWKPGWQLSLSSHRSSDLAQGVWQARGRAKNLSSEYQIVDLSFHSWVIFPSSLPTLWVQREDNQFHLGSHYHSMP